jgi:hypothetical protein
MQGWIFISVLSDYLWSYFDKMSLFYPFDNIVFNHP